MRISDWSSDVCSSDLLFGAFASAKAGVRALSQSLAREIGPKGVHVAHLVIDGGIHGDRLLGALPHLLEERGEDGLLRPEAIADSAFLVHRQQRSAWTQEIDLRPWRSEEHTSELQSLMRISY